MNLFFFKLVVVKNGQPLLNRLIGDFFLSSAAVIGGGVAVAVNKVVCAVARSGVER